MSAGDKSHDDMKEYAGTALCFEVLGFTVPMQLVVLRDGA